MKRVFKVGWFFVTAGALIILSACQHEPPSNSTPTVAPSFSGWIPEPSPTLLAYRDCLQRGGATVERVVGRYLLVPPAGREALATAEADCADEQRDHLRTITLEGHRYPDEAGYRFISQVRSCIASRHGRVPDESESVLVLEGHLPEDLEACLEEIRARPTPSVF
ncbi:hypothetical protein [Micromonospora chersina]|uniref:hypothetical protein n=1 Tax=Micromonospora chersina TaxID=47854 RepID=UPI0033AB78A6